MSQAPDTELEGFANAVALRVKNRHGEDVVVYRSEEIDGNYTEWDVVSADAFAEEIEPLKTYKYKAAFIGDGVVLRRSGTGIRSKQLIDAAPPTVSGSFDANEVQAGPPIVSGSFDIELTWL